MEEHAMAITQSQEMVLIPPGGFIMGSDWEPFYGTIIPECTHTRRDETPMHVAHLPGYAMDRFPVTNRDYLQFVEATDARPPRHWPQGKCPKEDLDLPAVNVTWHQAQSYADWVGKRLPTEAEWEKAARGVDARQYPWGNEFLLAKCSSIQTLDDAKRGLFSGLGDVPIPHIEPVGSHPDGVSPYGVEDMAGNVWEWTMSAYESYPNSSWPIKGSERDDRVIRGGSWKEVHDRTPHLYFRSATRWHVPETYSANNIGFRCARDLTPAEAANYTRQVAPDKLQARLDLVRQNHLRRVARVASRATFRDGLLGAVALAGGVMLTRVSQDGAAWFMGFSIVVFGLGLFTCVGINLWRTLKARRRLSK